MRILSFDAQANGDFGKIFCIGAVVVETQPEGPPSVIQSFLGLTQVGMRTNEPALQQKVIERVLPAIEDVQLNYLNSRYLHLAFLNWFEEFQVGATVVANDPYPVKTRLLQSIEEGALEDPAYQAAYRLGEYEPIRVIDLRSLLLGQGFELDDAVAFAGEWATPTYTKYNPLHDATLTAVCAAKILGTKNLTETTAQEAA